MKAATATGPSRQETQSEATREPESREPESKVRPIDEPSDLKLKTAPASSTLKSEPTVSQVANEEQIRRRAYELYVESGYSDGNHEEHWFAAERELSGKAK
jgi:hypothetical protein